MILSRDQALAFKENPSINPLTNHKIKQGSLLYKRLLAASSLHNLDEPPISIIEITPVVDVMVVKPKTRCNIIIGIFVALAIAFKVKKKR